jgi:phosphohistidine phosphatase
MATRDDHPPAAEYTTSEQDQRDVAKLQARLRDQQQCNSASSRLPSVEIAEGAHKYVLISAEFNGESQYIVTSRRGAAYHMNAAEPMTEKLQQAGYSDIVVTGGGRILYDEDARRISIFGHSYGFGRADHAISQEVILSDERYKDFDVTISNDGY